MFTYYKSAFFTVSGIVSMSMIFSYLSTDHWLEMIDCIFLIGMANLSVAAVLWLISGKFGATTWRGFRLLFTRTPRRVPTNTAHSSTPSGDGVPQKHPTSMDLIRWLQLVSTFIGLIHVVVAMIMLFIDG